MSVGEPNHSVFFFLPLVFRVLKKNPPAFFRSLPQQGHALGWNSALAPGNLLQFPQPLLQAPDQRGGSGIRVQLPRLGVSPSDPLFA